MVVTQTASLWRRPAPPMTARTARAGSGGTSQTGNPTAIHAPATSRWEADCWNRRQSPCAGAVRIHTYIHTSRCDPDGAVVVGTGAVPGAHPRTIRPAACPPHRVVPLSCGHPFVVRAVETLLEDRAVLSQYQVYCRTPGAKGTGNGSQQTPGAGAHYDYKPWRPVAWRRGGAAPAECGGTRTRLVSLFRCSVRPLALTDRPDASLDPDIPKARRLFPQVALRHHPAGRLHRGRRAAARIAALTQDV